MILISFIFSNHALRRDFLSVYHSVFLSFPLFHFLSFFFISSFCLSIFLSRCLSVSLSFCLSDFLSFCLSVSLSFCLTVFLSFCPSDFLSLCLSAICGWMDGWDGMDGQRSSIAPSVLIRRKSVKAISSLVSSFMPKGRYKFATFFLLGFGPTLL